MNTLVNCLLPLTQNLNNAGKVKNQVGLESCLWATLKKAHTTRSSVLAQCNIVCCSSRWLCALGSYTSLVASEKVLTLLGCGLVTTRAMATAFDPWYHIANVQFQTLCIDIAMDTPSALKLISEAMRTLRIVLYIYQFPLTIDAYSAARQLIVSFQKRDADPRALLAISEEWDPTQPLQLLH